MSDNYKITKPIALKIIKFRDEGFSFTKISNLLKDEDNVVIFDSSIRKFYRNYLLGKSRILPIDEINHQLNNPINIESNKKDSTKYNTSIKKEVKETPTTENEIDKDFLDNPIYQGISGNGISKGKKPSNDLLGIFNKKPIVK